MGCCLPQHKVGDVMDNLTNESENKTQNENCCCGKHASIFLPEISKNTVKYYGSKDEILNESLRTKNQGSFVIHPHSLFRRYWLWIMMIMSSINLCAIPLDVSFFGKQTYIGWTVYNVFVDLVFLVDLCLNFRTGYHGSNPQASVTLDLQRIRNHYLKTWFIPDLLAVLPVDFCLEITLALGTFDSDQFASIRKAVRIFGLLRLLRLLRLVRYVNECMEASMKSALELAYTVFGIFLICHWNSCFQFMLVTLMDYPANSWVTLKGLKDKPIYIQYTHAMFRSLCHMMTLNYGSGVPKGMSELWMMITSITVGTVLYALVLAKITALIATFDTSQRAFEDKHNELKVFVRHKQVPEGLLPRVFGHMENCYQGKWFNEKAILDELSEPLKLEVMQHICGGLLQRAFGDLEPLFLTELLLVVEFTNAQMGDVVVRPGTTADYMYFIDKGSVVVEHAGVEHTLMDGDYFGEIALEKLSEHSITATSLTPCRLCTLSVHAYHAVLENFPELKGKCLVRPFFADS
ncbi:hypothetical protein ACEWY4_021807 [Coilia grayii]|uniref:Cyclic nucleotide-binding domain-containing protein n=1 Tax=Coilia grayii TaxID=363190 RepID=A0ABD1J4F5_9TELE